MHTDNPKPPYDPVLLVVLLVVGIIACVALASFYWQHLLDPFTR